MPQVPCFDTLLSVSAAGERERAVLGPELLCNLSAPLVRNMIRVSVKKHRKADVRLWRVLTTVLASRTHQIHPTDGKTDLMSKCFQSISAARKKLNEMWHNSIWLKDVNLNLVFFKSWFCNFVTSCTALAVFICFAWHFSFLPDTRRCDLYGRSFTSSPMPFTNGRFYGFGKKCLIFF